MRFELSTILTPLGASLSLASPAWDAVYDWSHSPAGKPAPDHTWPGLTISFAPKHPVSPFFPPPPRTKTCYVQSHNKAVTDDTPYILEALHNGGHVVFREGVTYFIAIAMDLTFLDHIDLGIDLHVYKGVMLILD